MELIRNGNNEVINFMQHGNGMPRDVDVTIIREDRSHQFPEVD
jgi:hypothetical protein